jgi:hypothetical protein
MFGDGKTALANLARSESRSPVRTSAADPDLRTPVERHAILDRRQQQLYAGRDPSNPSTQDLGRAGAISARRWECQLGKAVFNNTIDPALLSGWGVALRLERRERRCSAKSSRACP